MECPNIKKTELSIMVDNCPVVRCVPPRPALWIPEDLFLRHGVAVAFLLLEVSCERAKFLTTST